MRTRSKVHVHVWWALLHTHAAVTDALEQDLRAAGAPPLVECEVLMRLSQATSEGMRMQDLAEYVLLSRSGLTRLVDRMQAQGLVDRTSCAIDRRGTYATLTKAGRDALERSRAILTTGVERHFLRHLDAEEAEVILSAFRKVLGAHCRSAGLGACSTEAQDSPR